MMERCGICEELKFLLGARDGNLVLFLWFKIYDEKFDIFFQVSPPWLLNLIKIFKFL
jgi:hypothetical protein